MSTNAPKSTGLTMYDRPLAICRVKWLFYRPLANPISRCWSIRPSSALCIPTRELTVITSAQNLPPSPLTDADTVIIETGAKTLSALYHRVGCASLRSTKQARLTLRDAKARFFQPHCLCITGRDVAPPCPSPVTAEARPLAIADPVQPLAAARTPVVQTVYITRAGERYHQATCRYLARRPIPMALDQAARRYSPCSVCDPPVFRGSPCTSPPASALVAVAPATPRAPASQAARQQCAATTKKGTRCLRLASAGSSFCWQHGG